MSLDAAFLRDLERCVRCVYALHQELAARRSHQAVDRIFTRDRRLVIGLTGQLLASIALIPVLGPGVVMAGLAVLYVGAFVGTAWALTRMRRATTDDRSESIELAVRRALATCPPLDAGGRALIIRLANLTAIPPTTRSLAMVRATLDEVKARPGLREWPFLDDVAVLVESSSRLALTSAPIR
jgi:hypothetical protein